MANQRKRKFVNFHDSNEQAEMLVTELVQKKNAKKFSTSLWKEKSCDLPMYLSTDHFLKEFVDDECETVILMGETGCGKSTQIPQILFQYCNRKFGTDFRLVITEPRRLAAVSLAARVQQELDNAEPTGTEIATTGVVGHKVRFDNCCTDSTKILFMTEGMLLQECISDPLLKKYNIIVIDEAHERSITTDLLLGRLKKLINFRNKQARKRHDDSLKLKAVIMTATGEADKLHSYFPKSKVLLIKGRTFDVDVKYLSPNKDSSDYFSKTVSIVMRLHNELPPDDHFLVFLTGQEEIEGVIRQLKMMNHSIPIMACPLYAALPEAAQIRAFQIPESGTRKIVVSTNIAETSLTIPGIQTVIDSGYVKSKYYLGVCSLEVFQVHRISKSQAKQRAGRAGRETPGKVIRAYTKKEYEGLGEFEAPEITRSSLTRALLLLPLLKASRIEDFPFLDPPDDQAIKDAQAELEILELMTYEDDTCQLTPLGRQLVYYPIEPKLAKVVWDSMAWGVLPEVCAIVGMMESDNIYMSSSEDERRKTLESYWAPEGDLITYLNLYRKFSKSKFKKKWCETTKVNLRAMNYAAKVRDQLLKLVREKAKNKETAVAPLSSNSAIKEAISSVFAKNIPWNRAIIDKSGKFYVVQDTRKFQKSKSFGHQPMHAKIHPTSALWTSKPPHLFFMKVTLNDKHDMFLHHCAVVV